MNGNPLNNLKIDPQMKERPRGPVATVFVGVILVLGVAVYFGWPRESDATRIKGRPKPVPAPPVESTGSVAVPTGSRPAATPPSRGGALLTVSGYIINRERIELSTRFMGVVKWIGVRKGDAVTNGQVVARLDDSEFVARLHEAEGRLAGAKASAERARLQFQRVSDLARNRIETAQALDDARLTLVSAEAVVRELEGSVELIRTYLDWAIIRSPISGVVLEKLVDPNELVTPQTFGGTRGPSTALIAVADPGDLQVEIDMNEADLSKIFLRQKCRVSPEAYPDHQYQGLVAEIAPEANRQKGTLQVKVQILGPDRFLTPELTAKVEFLE